jgi:hypothetical protein
MTRRSPALIAFFLIILILSACSGTATQNAFFGEEALAKQPDIPDEYDRLANPYTEDPAAIAEEISFSRRIVHLAMGLRVKEMAQRQLI